jgi:hypothetical protein
VIVSFPFDLNGTVAHSIVSPFAHRLLSRLGLVERNRRSLARSSPPAPVVHTHTHTHTHTVLPALLFYPSQPIESTMILRHLSQNSELRTDYEPTIARIALAQCCGPNGGSARAAIIDHDHSSPGFWHGITASAPATTVPCSTDNV